MPLVEQKINVLNQAAPRAGGDLSDEVRTLRRPMKTRSVKAGRP